MLGLAAAACCMPSHADWLNDLSLMPPVSVTMQPRKPAVDPLAVPDAAAQPPGLAALGADAARARLPVLLAVDELLPHAAISRVAAPAAATVATNEVCLTVFPSTGPDGRRPGLTRALPRSDCPEIISSACPAGRVLSACGHFVAKSRSERSITVGL